MKHKAKTKTNNPILSFTLPCKCSMWKEGDDWMFHHCKAHDALYEVQIHTPEALRKRVEDLTLNAHMHRLYKRIVRQAKRFAAEVEGDFSFSKNEVNFLCVEHMTMGWIYAQPWFDGAVRATLALYRRENIASMVNDIALQAATDATAGIKRFKC